MCITYIYIHTYKNIDEYIPTPCLSIVRPHTRAVRGRVISATKVKALPESLGQCKLLETLCVGAAAPPAVRASAAERAFALLRVRAACGAGRWAAPRGV